MDKVLDFAFSWASEEMNTQSLLSVYWPCSSLDLGARFGVDFGETSCGTC